MDALASLGAETPFAELAVSASGCVSCVIFQTLVGCAERKRHDTSKQNCSYLLHICPVRDGVRVAFASAQCAISQPLAPEIEVCMRV